MSSGEIFGHVRKAHEDLSKPSANLPISSEVAWAYKEENFNPDVNGKDLAALAREMNDTLTILSPEERFLLSIDNTLALAYGDIFALSYNENYARSSIAVKGQGRKDALGIAGTINQKVSMPTTLQKVKRVLTGRGGKVQEEETTDGVEIGGE